MFRSSDASGEFTRRVSSVSMAAARRLSVISEGTLVSRKAVARMDAPNKHSPAYNSYMGFIAGWVIIIGQSTAQAQCCFYLCEIL